MGAKTHGSQTSLIKIFNAFLCICVYISILFVQFVCHIFFNFGRESYKSLLSTLNPLVTNLFEWLCLKSLGWTGFIIWGFVASQPNSGTFSQHFSLKRRGKMKLNIFVFLIVAICVDIGLSMPFNRMKRQLGGTGPSLGKSI